MSLWTLNQSDVLSSLQHSVCCFRPLLWCDPFTMFDLTHRSTTQNFIRYRFWIAGVEQSARTSPLTKCCSASILVMLRDIYRSMSIYPYGISPSFAFPASTFGGSVGRMFCPPVLFIAVNPLSPPKALICEYLILLFNIYYFIFFIPNLFMIEDLRGSTSQLFPCRSFLGFARG